MKDYHEIWLSAHPERTREWLEDKLRDGFDIHHGDGNHTNNDATNLFLIECRDHMQIHGGSISRIFSSGEKARREAERMETGRLAYELKTPLLSWMEIGMALRPDSQQPQALARGLAKQYARMNNLPFPKPGTNCPITSEDKAQLLKTLRQAPYEAKP